VQVKQGEKTGVAVIIVEEQTGENRILLSPNANYTLQPDHFKSLPDPLPRLLVMQLEIPLDTVLQVLRVAKEKNVEVLLNPAPAVELPKEAYRSITHLVVNETEAAILAGVSEDYLTDQSKIPEVTERLLKLGAKNVIVTLGSKGVYFVARSGIEGFFARGAGESGGHNCRWRHVCRCLCRRCRQRRARRL